MESKPIIVGIGELLWDVFPEGKQLGGAPVNFAYHTAQFGFNCIGVSALGNDQLGDEIIELLQQKKVNTLTARVEFPTGTVQVKIDAKGVPTYEIKKNVAWDNIPWSDELQKIAEQTVAVCFGALAQRNEVSRASINRFLDTMPSENTYKIFDINLRQNFYTKDNIESSLQKCNVLKMNDEELMVVAKMFDCTAQNAEKDCRKLLSDFDLKMLILTCGTEGSYVFSKEGTSFIETPKVKVADTVGAGDSFAAAFCASILEGKSISKSHKKAVEVSAFVCTQNGAMPDMPAGNI